jgi:DNA-binding transcriptional MerR regulator
MPATSRYAIGDLATLGGVSRRTVRYYVQEGLIQPPLGLGRGNHYTPEHLQQLLRVKELQEAGRTLEEIRRELGPKGERAARKHAASVEEQPLPRSLWRRLPLAPGVELHVDSTRRLPPPAKLRALADWCRLHFPDAPQDKDENN